MEFIELSKEQRKDIFLQASLRTGVNVNLVEKDWWVCLVLRVLFSLPYSQHLSFKGGTTLSKCWNLIERMSEDVDMAIDREFLGFSGPLTRTQISDKLRRASCSFVRNKLQYELSDALKTTGLGDHDFSVNVKITPITTTDPEIIEIHYPSLFVSNSYIKDAVKIELSGRSMSEPVADVEIMSIVDETFPEASFVGSPFNVRAVRPERTFLEKLFLLHEEFSKPKETIRVKRMSRHLYDVRQIMQTPIAEKALCDRQLYNQVIEHRRVFTGLRGFDYTTLKPSTLNIIPPDDDIMEAWREDYENMCTTMIYGQSESYDKLIENLKVLNSRIRELSKK